MWIKNQEMQSEKQQPQQLQKPYLESDQAPKDYTETYFNRVFNYLKILPNDPMPSSTFPLLPSEYCFKCKKEYIKDSTLWCNECETKLFKENFNNWTSGIDLLDDFIKKTQLSSSSSENFLKLIPFEEFEDVVLLEEGGYSKVYLASWDNGLYFGTMKGWINEVEKHDDDFIWKLIYEEAPNYVREVGIQYLFSVNKKKPEGLYKLVTKLKNKRKSLSKTDDLKLWKDRVFARLEIEITKGNISFPFNDKSTTGSQYIVLKQLKNSNNIGPDFIRQLNSYYTVMSSDKSPKLYGISQDPETEDYILVMQYASGGDLRQYIRDNFVEIDWFQKISILLDIAKGLKAIHDHEYVHRNFHSGNILLNLSKSFVDDDDDKGNENLKSFTQKYDILISDLGLSNEFSKSSSNSKKLCGIIPYVAPEILSNDRNNINEETYTKSSDVYSFAMIMWELTSGRLPFVHFSHDEILIQEIINGLRPEIIKGTPKFYLDLMEKSWDNLPLKRPNINDIIDIIENWKSQWNLNSELSEKAEIERKELIQSNDWILFNNYKNNEAFYFSRVLNF